jgi:hypothetical protein
MNNIPILLANRLLRNASRQEAGAHLLLGEWPEYLAYTPPIPTGTDKLACVVRGPRQYELLQESAASPPEIQAYYLNQLRLTGWLYRSDERNDEKARAVAPLGFIRTPQLPLPQLSFFHPGQNLVLHLQFVASSDALKDSKAIFLLSIKEAPRYSELHPSTCRSTMNHTPAPILLPLEESYRRDGSASGSERSYREVRLIESDRALLVAYQHYQQQLEALDWNIDSTEHTEGLASGQWRYQDSQGQSWRLFLCLAVSSVVKGYLSVLSVEAVTDDRCLVLTDASTLVPASLVEQLLQIKHPDALLYFEQLSVALQNELPVPDNAQLLAAIERPEKQWMYWLNFEGSVSTVYEEVSHQLELTGWKLLHAAARGDAPGFTSHDSQMIAPRVFYRGENPNKRLRLWAIPWGESSVTVELLIDFLPEGRAYSEAELTTDEQTINYPTLKLNPPDGIATHVRSHAISYWQWNSTAELTGAQSLAQLAAHYGEQLTAAGWRSLSSTQVSENTLFSASSWAITDSQGKQWQGILRIAAPVQNTSFSLFLHVVTTNPALLQAPNQLTD